MLSSSWARMLRGSTVWVVSRMRSASVDFPWSMWAMIEKFRMWAWSAMRLRLRGGAPDPAADQIQDLVRLGDPEPEHRAGVHRAAERHRREHGDQLGEQRP